jgi:hypothetical protein
MSTEMKWLIAIGFVIVLYYLKVPVVVSTVNGILTPLTTTWNYLIDVALNLRERHPFIWMSLPFFLMLLMSPAARR